MLFNLRVDIPHIMCGGLAPMVRSTNTMKDKAEVESKKAFFKE